MKKDFVLITGGTGSLGKALALNLAKNNHVRIYSRNEERQFELEQIFIKRGIRNYSFVIGDIQDEVNLERALRGIKTVIHAAAMKDLVYCELNPTQCIKNNISGSQILLNAIAKSSTVKRVCGISTDKASSPSSTYGASKLIMESLFLDFSKQFPSKNTTIARFGNMIDSHGSLISHWAKNPDSIKGIGHKDLSRFFFTINDAIELVINVTYKKNTGTITIPFMKKIFIRDIIHILNPKKVKNIIGLQPGEKISELLVNSSELLFAKIGTSGIELSRNIAKQQKLNSNVLAMFDSSTAPSYSAVELNSIVKKMVSKEIG
jgi:FlaA1/EpsC-like NDP-sugar epimerase